MSERTPPVRKATKKDVQELAERFDELLDLADEDLEGLESLGMADHPVAIALEWLVPQGERMVKRGQRGDLSMMRDESMIGLLAAFEVMTELGADLIEAMQTSVHEMVEQASPLTHKR